VLCGLWHGAAATFLLWGIYHGALLIAERLYRERFGERPGGPLAWATTLLLIMIGWVFFRCPTLPDAFHFIGVLSGLVQNEAAVWKQSFLNGERVVVLAIGLVFALVRFEDYSWRVDGSRVSAAFKSGAALIVFTYAIMLLSFRSFNPFIYFRF